MEKNRVVIFGPRRIGARVFITNDPSSIRAGILDLKLVNPILNYVHGVPPEFWTIESDGQIKPMQDEKQIKARFLSYEVKDLQVDNSLVRRLKKLELYNILLVMAVVLIGGFLAWERVFK